MLKVLESDILEKPTSEDDARMMLKRFECTSICVYNKGIDSLVLADLVGKHTL